MKYLNLKRINFNFKNKLLYKNFATKIEDKNKRLSQCFKLPKLN